MEKKIAKVTEFHRSIGEKVADDAELLEQNIEADRKLANGLRELIAKSMSDGQRGSHLNRRALMAIEELAEWIEAHTEGDLVAAADALGDRIYVLLGDAVATGLPASELFDEVHRSNMTKRATSADSGKGTKSDSFEAPNIAGILGRASQKEIDV
ncbi:Phosphoribosyl-ATP pyrophosphohydrolase [Novipirellula aureliae]|uniref:Phosphoribosyl-ATP pyrophosphohydrolase n=1 Tax=Novipirellula aureliae TaxID=2527966 RepID=A0A5C6DR62_9BACT|nr:nucleoside triphosphate pyrophosphohydrolase family protein [Novipirellula aureliae]TWU38674.1 Phosphoribosyl-ATP pyrophosphohydrolase [Novipirellula aureliae]